ncbi:MAG: hypothetical protein M5U01_29945 [Ardenticatenaceae bacterium]|nr:hypothetical protein [Ardenticatenaceae bacterium]
MAILAGLPHLKDVSLAAHPLDQDQAVAYAWGQPGWADYRGVSRTLHGLTIAEAQQTIAVVEGISQPLLDRKVVLALRAGGRLVYDGDLTGRLVSNTSTSYPDAAYGHTSDTIRLGYQAAMVSLHSPTYGRLWLSVTPHPGDTVSCTQAMALVEAAERRTQVRPRRRTELLTQRLQLVEMTCHRLEARQQDLQAALDQVRATREQVRQHAAHLAEVQRAYSHLARARPRLEAAQRREASQDQLVSKTEQRLARHTRRLDAAGQELRRPQARLAAFEQDNATNPAPIQAVFRFDAGFETYENLAGLIELGYDVYAKPYSHHVTNALRRRLSPETAWTRVGANAEMIAWADLPLAELPYPLNIALERFHTRTTIRYATLLHYGRDPVTTDLSTWFRTSNGRQLVEAGIKEGKAVFQMHHLKVRSPAALWLQEHCAAFAANFVRWAAHWLVTQCPQLPTGWSDLTPPPVKTQVDVAAHTSTWVVWQPSGCLLEFTSHSLFAGSALEVKEWAVQPALPLFKNDTQTPLLSDLGSDCTKLALDFIHCQ